MVPLKFLYNNAFILLSLLFLFLKFMRCSYQIDFVMVFEHFQHPNTVRN